MTADVHQPSTEPPVAAPAKKTWREKRWERRRRRFWFEEMLAWILVPIILVGSYWLVVAGLDALGTSPSAIINGIGAIVSAL